MKTGRSPKEREASGDHVSPAIVLINPYVPPHFLGTISPWEVQHLGLGYIAAVLERHGKRVHIIDASIERLDIDKLTARLNPLKPFIIGITGNVYSAKYAVYTAFKLRKVFPDTIFVMGGPYATSSYDLLLKRNIADIIVLGEGEFTFLELVDLLENGGDISEVRGIAYRYDNPVLKRFLKKSPENNGNLAFISSSIVLNKRRPYIEDLDSLPFPAWHLFPHPKKYRNLRGVVKRPYVPIITSRGCQYACLWCNKNIHGYKIRGRSAENVVEEILYFKKKYNIKEVEVVDDNFAYDPKRLIKICYLLRKNNIKVGLNLYSGLRADMLDWKIIMALKSVGVNRITVGVESGNQRIVKKIGKGLDLNRVLKSVALIRKAGLVADGFFMLGLPFDTEKTMEETIAFAKKAGFDHAYFFVTIPFPGTALYELVKRKGKFIKRYFFGIPHHIVEGEPVYIMNNLNTELIKKMFKKAYISFYINPRKILQLTKVYGRYILVYRSFTEVKWLMSQVIFLLINLASNFGKNLGKFITSIFGFGKKRKS